MKSIKIASLLIFAYTSALAQGQADKVNTVDVERLPEYILIGSESTARMMGPMTIVINSKGSPYEAALVELEGMLTDKDKLRILNQTDLLNAISDMGFDYVDAFIVGRGDFVNMVFRKKPEYRQANN